LCDQRADLLHAAGGERDVARRVVAVREHGYEDAAKLRGSGGNSLRPDCQSLRLIALWCQAYFLTEGCRGNAMPLGDMLF
jgi:hypothetical protein